jgi:Uncharacterised nucleotidyltransferase
LPNQPHVSPEAELLIRLAARQPIDQLEVHWPRVKELARRHKLQPLLFWSLSHVPIPAVPPSVLDSLQSNFLQNVKENLRLAADLNALLDLFSERKILAVPFKGVTLASSIYGNLALRAAGDIDLLIPRSDMPAANAALRELGYIPDSPRTEADEVRMLGSIYNYHLGFAHPQTGITVEPHWNVMPPYYSGDVDLFVSVALTRLTQQDLCGFTRPALADEDLLLILSIHSNRHLWERLSWLLDIAELTRARPNLNWSLVLSNARAIGQKRLTLLGLLLASDLAGATVPTEILDSARASRPIRSLANQVKSWLFKETGAPTGLTGQLFLMRSMDRPVDRLNWAWHQIISRLK